VWMHSGEGVHIFPAEVWNANDCHGLPRVATDYQ